LMLMEVTVKPASYRVEGTHGDVSNENPQVFLDEVRDER
jgi:hypothetical protein